MARAVSFSLRQLVVHTSRFTILAVVILAPLVLRARMESRNALLSARHLQAEGDLSGAIDSYRKSLSWRLPFDDTAAKAASELSALAAQPELPVARALEALEQLERGLVSSRSWVWSLPGAWTGITEEEVSERIASRESPPAIRLSEGARSPPHLGWQLVAQILFWGWLLTTIYTIWRGFESTGPPNKQLLRLGSIPIALLISWLAALSQS